MASCFEPRQTALSVGQVWRQRIWVPGGALRDTGTRGSWAASPEGGADRAEEGSQQSRGAPSWGGPSGTAHVPRVTDAGPLGSWDVLLAAAGVRAGWGWSTVPPGHGSASGSVSLSLYLSISFCLSVSISFYLCLCLSFCLSISLSLCPCLSLHLCLSPGCVGEAGRPTWSSPQVRHQRGSCQRSRGPSDTCRVEAEPSPFLRLALQGAGSGAVYTPAALRARNPLGQERGQLVRPRVCGRTLRKAHGCLWGPACPAGARDRLPRKQPETTWARCAGSGCGIVGPSGAGNWTQRQRHWAGTGPPSLILDLLSGEE